MKGLSSQIASHVAQADSVPDYALDAAKRSLLDAIGVSLGASRLEEVQPFVSLARQSGGGACDVFGADCKVSAPMAALANGAMAHALDYEDALDGAPLHPNAALVPAVLAIAQNQGGVSGIALLSALAIGCDVSCRLAISLRAPMERGGWYPPPILGAFGAAAGAARAARLNSRGVLDAFSLMLCQTSCSGEIKRAEESVIRAVRDAFPAQAAVNSVMLAHSGLRGFDQPIEGADGFFALYVGGAYDAATALEDLGHRYFGAELSYKPWPSCRGTHAYIEAALALRAQPDFSLDEIASIELRGHAVQQMLAEPREAKCAPHTSIDAKFSLPYTCAVALIRGTVGLEDFSTVARSDPSVLALAQRVTFQVGDDIPSSVAGEMVLRRRDGARVQHRVLTPPGSPVSPLRWDDLVAKATACAAFGGIDLPADRIGALAHTIQSLETESDATAAIFKALRGASPCADEGRNR